MIGTDFLDHRRDRPAERADLFRLLQKAGTAAGHEPAATIRHGSKRNNSGLATSRRDGSRLPNAAIKSSSTTIGCKRRITSPSTPGHPRN